MSWRRTKVASRGFTLIELLVVIAIISLLAALLLPSLRRAKDRGKNAVCISNQRQIAIAVFLYADDNSGWVPGGGWTTNQAARGVSAIYRNWGYVGGSGLGFWNNPMQVQQILRPYVNVYSAAWMCPGWPLDYDLWPGQFVVGSPTTVATVQLPTTQRNLGFGYNYRPWGRSVAFWPVGGGLTTYNWSLRVGVPADSTAADLFACVLWDPQTYGTPVGGPHSGATRWNVSFLDGSVRATGGLATGTYNMFVNLPPDLQWAWWGP